MNIKLNKEHTVDPRMYSLVRRIKDQPCKPIELSTTVEANVTGNKADFWLVQLPDKLRKRTSIQGIIERELNSLAPIQKTRTVTTTSIKPTPTIPTTRTVTTTSIKLTT